MKRNTFHKLLSMFLAVALCLTLVPAVFAVGGATPTINTTATGSITVTKYVTTDDNSGAEGATGTTADATKIDPAVFTTVEGVKFRLYQVVDTKGVVDYYNGTTETAYELATFYDSSTGAVKNDKGTTVSDYSTGTTDANGVYTFTGLAVGMYVLVEESTPAQITTFENAALISIPMVNTATSNNNNSADWIYDVNVYPKNTAEKASATITKLDAQDNPIPGVSFTLEAYDFAEADNGVVPSDATWKTFYAAGTSLETGTDGKLTLSDLTAGTFGTQYRLVEVSAPNGYIANTTPIYFYIDKDKIIHWNEDASKGVQNKNERVASHSVEDNTKLSFTLYNERSTLTKEVKENGGSSWKHDEQYRLDDTIDYKITVYVPLDIATMDTFTIEDTPAEGIDDDYTSVKVDGKAVTATEADNGFKLDIKDCGLSDSDIAAKAGKDIEITYSSKMNGKAVIGANGNDNTATLTYSTATNDTATVTPGKYTITDMARVLTYQFKITKRKDTEAGAIMEGVVFELHYGDSATTANSNNAVPVVEVEAGVYRLAVDSDSSSVTSMSTNASGELTIQGLENANTYYLKETKTLTGYNLLSEPYNFEVNITESTAWDASGDSYGEQSRVRRVAGDTAYKDEAGTTVEAAMQTANIINKKGFVLPKTGSIGFVMFGIVGLALVAAGLFLLFGKKKRYAE